MKIGIMGMHYGHISGMFHSAVNASNGEIVGIVESDDALCENYTADHNITRFATLDLMLEKAKPDLVIEGLAHHEKTHVIETCAAAGVHMLLDKPLCRTREELQRIKTAVTKNNIKLSTFFTSRCYGAFIALRQAIQNGDLGDLVSLITTHPHKLGASGVQLRQQVNPPALYFDADKYVGTFHDLAGHGVDQVRWLTGAEYTGVHALGTLKKHINTGLTFDHVQASFQLDNGALATATADWLTPKDARSFGDTRFIIMGTEGSAHLRAYADDHVLIVSNKSGTYEPELSPSTNHAFVENMIDAFARGKENFISTDDTLAVANACITAEESARKGGKFLAIR